MGLPNVKIRMSVQTKEILRRSKNLLTVGELSYSAGIGAGIIAEEARTLAPLGPTGNLKRGIVAKENKKASGFAVVGAAYVGVDYGIAPHAHLVEFGARGGEMPAHPFIRPAVDAKQNEVLRAIEADLTARINKKLNGI